MRRFFTRRNTIILVVVLLGVGGWWWRDQASKRKAKEEIRIVEVQRNDITETLTVAGKVTAGKMAILNFSTGGKLGFVRVSEGDRVEQGAWLMGLDTGDLKAAETRAWYAYMAADANAKQVEDEVKGHDKDETFVQKNARVAAQTARDSAWENILVAQRAVGNAILKAPFGGVATSITSKAVGDTVGVADGVTVVDVDTMYFEVEIDESDLGKVVEGQEVIVVLDAFDGDEFSGKLAEIGFTARVSSTGATVFPAKIVFDENGVVDKLRLGMNGDGEIVLGKVDGVLAVPIEAVIDGEVEKENGEKVKVETGLESETEVEIKSGINEGEKIVIK